MMFEPRTLLSLSKRSSGLFVFRLSIHNRPGTRDDDEDPLGQDIDETPSATGAEHQFGETRRRKKSGAVEETQKRRPTDRRNGGRILL